MDAAGLVRGLHTEDGRRDPYPWYARMHDVGEIFVFDEPVAGYDAVAHGFAAVDQVLRDPSFHLMDAEYEDAKGTRWRDHEALLTLKQSIFFMNGAAHSQIRRLFNNIFTARRVAELQPAITRLTEAALDRIAGLGADGQVVEFMGEFAFPPPSNIMGELIGVPEEDRNWYRPRARAMGDILDLDTINWTTMRRADTSVAELNAFFTDLTAKRRADPHGDLMSGLLQAQDDDAAWLRDDVLFANLITVFNAGFVTTTQMFGHAVALLARRPEMLRAMLDDRSLVASYVEEILRYEPPVHFMIRRATVTTEVAGAVVPAGSLVLVLVGAANRDPRRFAEPDEFRPSRSDNHAIGFGAGAHHCLGAALTRVEGSLALPMLFERFPDIEIVGELAPPTQLTLRGYDVMPVRLSGGARRGTVSSSAVGAH
jgi:cytochrome P450